MYSAATVTMKIRTPSESLTQSCGPKKYNKNDRRGKRARLFRTNYQFVFTNDKKQNQTKSWSGRVVTPDGAVTFGVRLPFLSQRLYNERDLRDVV